MRTAIEKTYKARNDIPLLDKEEFDSLALLEQKKDQESFTVQVSSLGMATYDFPEVSAISNGTMSSLSHLGLFTCFVLWFLLFVNLFKRSILKK